MRKHFKHFPNVKNRKNEHIMYTTLRAEAVYTPYDRGVRIIRLRLIFISFFKSG